MSKRLIGIRHRRKKTADEEAHPTIVAIGEGNKIRELKLETDTDELDFVLGQFPTLYKEMSPDDDITTVIPRHVKTRAGKTFIPVAYEGLQATDCVAMVLGGSGDRFAYALSRMADEVGAEVFRTPTYSFSVFRGDRNKNNDQRLLISFFLKEPDAFYRVEAPDRTLIAVREAYIARRDAQKDRIACQLRLYQREVGKIFLSQEGKYPEGRLEDSYDALKTNDSVFSALAFEEKERTKELQKAVRAHPVWSEIFAPVEGCGEVLASSIIASVVDIRRFPTKAKFKAYLGVHLTSDGKFQRKRKGQVANWRSDARQAFYLLADQWNRRPNSYWGKELRKWKAVLSERHPEEVAGGKKRYTKGHIHKMAMWRTITKFAEHVFVRWWALEREGKL